MSTQDKPFSFDSNKDFAANCESFLERIAATDPELTAMLRDNWQNLLAIVQEGDRNPKARSEFNASIGKALDALLIKQSHKPNQ